MNRMLRSVNLYFVLTYLLQAVFILPFLSHILYSLLIPPSCMSYYILGPLAETKQIAQRAPVPD